MITGNLLDLKSPFPPFSGKKEMLEKQHVIGVIGFIEIHIFYA
jgi:hypothetical protein